MTDYVKDFQSENETGFKKYARDLVLKFDTDTNVVDGVVRWKSNNRVPPADILELWAHCEKPFDHAGSEKTRREEQKKFLNDYIEANKDRQPIEEEIAMARGAHGPGVTLVNVITGRKFKT